MGTHCPATARRQSGITILEVMITVAILGIMTGLAVPSIRSAVQNSRAASHANEFIAALNFARSEAVKRRANVTICTSGNGTSCRAAGAADAANWHRGWIVLVGNTVIRAEAGLDSAFTMACTPAATCNQVTFAGTGSSTTTPSFNLVASGCVSNNNRTISLGVTGRVSVARANC